MTLEERIKALENKVAELEAVIKAAPRRVYMTDVIRWRLVDALPEIRAKHPDGVTARHVADHFGFPLDSTRIGIRACLNAGKIVRVQRPGQHEQILLLPGESVPPRQLSSKSQRLLLLELSHLATNGILELSVSRIAASLGSSAGTVNYQIGCLLRDGKVRLIKRGASCEPSTYFIPSAVQ